MKELYKGCLIEVNQDGDCIFFDVIKGKKIIYSGVNSDGKTTLDEMVNRAREQVDIFISK